MLSGLLNLMVNLDECGYAEWERSAGILRAELLEAIA
jgi:hypothetical protein